MNDTAKINRRERIISLSLYALLFIVWSTIFFKYFGIEFYKKYFQVPLTMVFGSFLGGFTCEGGGAVAFPVFTKVLHIDPRITRDFSFAIQSIGMTFASITILLRRIKIEVKVVLFAVLGGLIGIVVGTYKIVPYVAPAQTRLIFTLVVTSFGVALFLKNFLFKVKAKSSIENFKLKDAFIIGIIGLIGGLFSSMIGTGIHFITFSFVTLLYRLDEKVATPTSILIMASDSIFGFIFRRFVIQQFSGQAIAFWMLCIPVVALFAPLGAILCSKVSRGFIVKFLLMLIGLELISTLFILKFDFYTILLSIVVIAVSFCLYLSLIKLSKRFTKEGLGREV